MRFDRFHRIPLAHIPTPLEPMPRMTEALSGPRFWIKRDDCTGLAGGGNKTRKLEYLLAEALELGAGSVLTPGAIQSNHARQTAAAAAKLGLECHLLLEEEVPRGDSDYARSGNILIDRLCRARIHLFPKDSDMETALDALEGEMRADGKRPYAIPVGGSSPRGSLGYVRCAKELLEQSRSLGVEVDLVVLASGSAGTQAGLLAGFAGLGVDIPVLGVCVSRSAPEQEDKVLALARKTLELLEVNAPFSPERVRANGDYVGEGYGVPTAEMIEAVTLTARMEGILLDPVYTGKAMAGLIDLARTGSLTDKRNVVFLHTGGAVGLFAYCSSFDAVE
ncbi:MAG TPA: D-cysteine desulfhydrase [Gammaproteobacteria bacterium]|nr:D-cysteine desulfhydrase [Gammaproteobacteria bacterium]